MAEFDPKVLLALLYEAILCGAGQVLRTCSGFDDA
jgi:hypothetical protein